MKSAATSGRVASGTPDETRLHLSHRTQTGSHVNSDLTSQSWMKGWRSSQGAIAPPPGNLSCVMNDSQNQSDGAKLLSTAKEEDQGRGRREAEKQTGQTRAHPS